MWAICIYCYVFIFIEGSLEVKLPTIWTDEKQSRAEAERTERLEERRSEKRKTVPLKKCAFLQFAHLRPQAKLQKKKWENKKTNKKFRPMSPARPLPRPCPWVYFFCFLVFSWFWPNCKNHGKTKITQNNKSSDPCPLSSLSSDHVHGSELFVFFGFLEVLFFNKNPFF